MLDALILRSDVITSIKILFSESFNSDSPLVSIKILFSAGGCVEVSLLTEGMAWRPVASVDLLIVNLSPTITNWNIKLTVFVGGLTFKK